MNAGIEGMAWVTPLGADLDEVWTRMRNGERGEIRRLAQSGSARPLIYMAVPAALTKALERQPRLRRASAISLLTASAGLAALEQAGVAITPDTAERIAIVFSISDGGVVYTRKFYEQIVTQGANAASPLLFPETVYNAPASHLAALLGTTGMTYTLVGDSSAGISAIAFAEQILATSDVDYVLVVGGEEVDSVLCEAYGEWRLARATPDGQGLLLSEGAAALVMGRSGATRIAGIHAGVPFFRRSEAGAAIEKVFGQLMDAGTPGVAIASANGTFIDAPERAALMKLFPGIEILSPKSSIGEAPGASALMQTIAAALYLENNSGASRALVSCLGINQQAAGLVLEKARPR